jgi:beta-glucosidase
MHFLTDSRRWGLSYTTFQLSDLHVTRPTKDGAQLKLSVDFTLTNNGSLKGSEVVQIYVTMPRVGSVQHPEKQLRAFKKLKDLEPGASITTTVMLDKYAVSYWHEPSGKWRAEKGTYTVLTGTSSNSLIGTTFELEEAFSWSGL